MTAAARTLLRVDMIATLRLAAPMIVAQVSMLGQGVVEAILAGHLSAHVLGAVAIGANVWGLAYMATSGILLAVPPSIAQLCGAGRRHEVASVFRQAVWLALAIGPAMALALWWGGPALADLLGVERSLAADVSAYLRAAAFAMPPVALLMCCRGLCEGVSMPRPSMVVGIAGLAALVPLGYALMYGAFGMAPLGARGAGLAGTILCWVEGIAFLAYVRFAPQHSDLGWNRSGRGPHLAAVVGLLRIGVPMGVSVLLEASLFCIAGLVVGRFGEVQSGAYQVALNVAALSFMVPLGTAFAVTVRVGTAVGRRDPAGVRRAGFAGLALVLATQAVASVILLSVPGSLVGLFTSDPEVQEVGTILLRLAGLFQLADGVQVAANGALRGLKDTRVPMLITAFAYWGVGMPVGLFLALHEGWEAPGMWIGLIAGLFTAATLLSLRFHVRTRGVRTAPRALSRTAA